MKTTNGWRTLRCQSPHSFKLLIDWSQHCWKNTKCIKAIHVEIRVSCVIYKLAHGYNFVIFIKLFAIGKSIVSLVLHEFVTVMNIVFWKLISWLVEANMCTVMNDFKLRCGLSSVQGAIHGTNLLISKPSMPFLEEYYYFKYGGYSIVA